MVVVVGVVVVVVVVVAVVVVVVVVVVVAAAVVVWVAAVVVAKAVVEGEAMVVTSTLGWVMGTTSLYRTQWMQTQSVANLGLLSSTCVLVFDVVIGLIL